LLPILHIAQEESGGYLSVDVMDYVAGLLNIQPVEVYEVATFYTQFRLEITGKYLLEVCRTTPCAICGGEDIFEYLSSKLGIADGENHPRRVIHTSVGRMSRRLWLCPCNAGEY